MGQYLQMRSVLWVKNGIWEISNRAGTFRSMLYYRTVGIIHLWAVCWIVLSLLEDSFLISCRGGWCCPKIPVPSPPALLLSLWLRSGNSKTRIKNSLLQISCSKYTGGRIASLKWWLNTHLAGTILKSGSADLGGDLHGLFEVPLRRWLRAITALCFWEGNLLNPQAGLPFWGWHTIIIAGFFCRL